MLAMSTEDGEGVERRNRSRCCRIFQATYIENFAEDNRLCHFAARKREASSAFPRSVSAAEVWLEGAGLACSAVLQWLASKPEPAPPRAALFLLLPHCIALGDTLHAATRLLLRANCYSGSLCSPAACYCGCWVSEPMFFLSQTRLPLDLIDHRVNLWQVFP